MRRAAQRDRNDKAHRERMEALGWTMFPFSVRGWPDYYAAKGGRTAWVEIKVPGEPFTPDQMEQFERLRQAGVPVYVLAEEGDARRFSGGYLPAWTPESVEKVWSSAGGRKSTTRPHRPGEDRARSILDMCATFNCAKSRLPGDTLCQEHADVVPAPRRRG